MFTSHEKIEDFEHFFDSMHKLGDQFDFVFEPKFLVSDAWRATAASVAKKLPNTTHLMCYFHLKYNVRKLKNNIIPLTKYVQVMTDVTKLHDTLTSDS